MGIVPVEEYHEVKNVGNYNLGFKDGNKRGSSAGYSEGLFVGRLYHLVHQSTLAGLDFLDYYLDKMNGREDLELVRATSNRLSHEIAFLERVNQANPEIRVEGKDYVELLKQRTEQIKQRVSLLEQKAKA